MWIIIRLIVDGRDGINCWSDLERIFTVAPGRHTVVALKKRTFLTILSPIISVVGEKSGRGGESGCVDVDGTRDSMEADGSDVEGTADCGVAPLDTGGTEDSREAC